MRTQSGPSVAQSLVSPVAARRPDLGADPLELAGQVLEARLVLLRRQVRGVRVVERLDHAPDRAVDERLLVDVAAGVAVLDRVVRVPERLEGVGPARRRARLGVDPLADEDAGHEEGATGEDRDDAHRDGQDRRSAPRRRRARAAGPGAGSAIGGWR